MSALDEALDRKMESVALATIGTGFQAVDLHDWLTSIAPEIVSYLGRNPRDKMSEADKARARKSLAVLLVLYERDDFDSLVELLRKVVAPI